VVLVDCAGRSHPASAGGGEQHRLYECRTTAVSRVQHNAIAPDVSVVPATVLQVSLSPMPGLHATKPMPCC